MILQDICSCCRHPIDLFQEGRGILKPKSCVFGIFSAMKVTSYVAVELKTFRAYLELVIENIHARVIRSGTFIRSPGCIHDSVIGFLM